MSSIRTDILARVYFAFGLIVLFAAAVLFKLFQVQVIQGAHWRKEAKSSATQFKTVEAVRGNIYGVDGSLLATSVPEYDIRIDLLATGIEDDNVFDEKVDSLAASLSAFLKDKTPSEYSRFLREGRKNKERYKLICKNVSHADMLQIKKFPMLNMKNNGGGLIIDQKNHRIKPFKDLAARTIGYKNDNVQPVGLEGAYGKYINGESGRRLMYKIAGNFWVPVNSSNEIETKDGADIISTIDIGIQDVAQRALLTQLKKSDADHGCVILMEVNTGEIRAIANYTKAKDGTYQELFNYAIHESLDPGSTFKLASYMALLEDKKVDTNTVVNTPNAGFTVFNHTIKESHGPLGSITVKKAFEVSSNVAVSMLVYNNYAKNPRQFTDYLYKFGLNKPLGLQIPGEGMPVIKNPSNRSWSGMSVAQMAYGYEMNLTPLQMLTFYNSVANNGKAIAPLFVREIRRLGTPIETFNARVINEQVCSKETLGKVKKMLEGVVEEGTGKDVIKNPYYKVAGKTGTAQVADGSQGYKAKKVYQASFCGYFPANNPKYSMIVVLNNPKGAYYAAVVAGPVFREVADMVYANDFQMFKPVAQQKLAGSEAPSVKASDTETTRYLARKLGVPIVSKATTPVSDSGATYHEGVVPNVQGMGLRDAMFLVGNVGLRVVPKGTGKVIRQSVAPGVKLAKGSPIVLELN
ncbi:MAG: penicillin-binding protein [Sphingobacteriaceae bacterium]